MTLGMMRNLSLQRREVMMMSDARKATTTLQFNGKNVDTSLKEYLESVTYADVASGSSDTLAISQFRNFMLPFTTSPFFGYQPFIHFLHLHYLE